MLDAVQMSKLGNKFFVILVNILSYSLLSTFVILQNFFLFLRSFAL